MATVYHRDQPGAPALVYAATAQGGFNAFKTILKACLVEGYAGKAAAGWQLINEGSAFIVLRSGTQSGYVCFTLFSSVIRVYLAETYAGVTGDVIAGAGVKSGNATGLTLPQAVKVDRTAGYSSSSTWLLVADEKTFVLAVFATTGTVNHELTSAVSPSDSWTLCIGEDSSGNFIAAGGSASISGSGGIPSLDYNAGFTSLKNPATGLLVGSSELPMYFPSMVPMLAGSGPGNAATASVGVMPEVTLSPIPWMASGAWSGRLRGLALCPEVQGISYPSIAAQCLGRTGPLHVREGNEPISLGDGYSYFARAGHYYSSFWLITDNPEFW